MDKLLELVQVVIRLLFFKNVDLMVLSRESLDNSLKESFLDCKTFFSSFPIKIIIKALEIVHAS